ncbi:uncharacterized protein [Argopecten irradians]|uniref:uncharacterized protein isoform X2 n=1 Tax=Argopecten irradians TaxID=31199 RepID=UPI003712CC1F
MVNYDFLGARNKLILNFATRITEQIPNKTITTMASLQRLALCVAGLSVLVSSKHDRILRATFENQYIELLTSGWSDNSSSKHTTQMSRISTSSSYLETWIIEANGDGNTIELYVYINIDICATCTCDQLYIYDDFKITIIIISAVVFISFAISCAICYYCIGKPKNRHQPQTLGPPTPQHCSASTSDNADPPPYREVCPDTTPHVPSPSTQFEPPSLYVMNCHNPVYDSDRQSTASEETLPPASERNDLHVETCRYPVVQQPLPVNQFRNFASLHTLPWNNGESERPPTYEDFCQNPEAFKMK